MRSWRNNELVFFFTSGRAEIVAMRAGSGPDWKIRPVQTSKWTLVFFISHILIVQLVQKKKPNTPIYFNTNYRGEMKLVPIIMG